MTRISSLLNWLGDFLRRCFAKSYIVKAEGDSPKTHDFRRCPNCGTFVDALYRSAVRQDCSKCGTFLMSSMSYGVYKDSKKREFILKKNLYSRYFIFSVIFWTIFTVLWIFVFFEHHDFVPQELKWFNEDLIFLLVPILLSFLSWVIFDIVSNAKPLCKKISNISAYFCGIYFAMIMFSILGFPEMGLNWAFRWENPPTKVEWETQQNKIAVAEFEKLKGVERLEFALQQLSVSSGSHEWSERVYTSFADAFKEDFPKTMELRSKYPDITIPKDVVYTAYERYLSNLAENSRDELARQCEDDPFGLQSYTTLAKYSAVFAPCKTLN